jgi:hypothetical protein
MLTSNTKGLCDETGLALLGLPCAWAGKNQDAARHNSKIDRKITPLDFMVFTFSK